jgi:O-antigen/teichoic acid export membrane protein
MSPGSGSDRDRNQAVRDIVRGASVVSVGLALELLIAFLAQVLAARYLSVSGFGGLTTGTALLNVGSIVGGLGFAAGLTRYLPRIETGEKRQLVRFVVAATAAVSVVLGTVLALNASFVAGTIFGDPSVAVSIAVFSAAIPFAALLDVALGGIRGQKNSRYQVYIKNLLQPSLRFALVVAAVLLGLDQAGIAGAYALPYVASAAAALVLLFRILPSEGKTLERDLTVRLARYSLPFTLTKLSSFVYRSIDVFLVLHFLGSAAVGVYGVAYAAVSFMGMLSTAFSYLGSPVASELEAEGTTDDVIRVFRSVVRWLVVGSVCLLVPLGLFAGDFISVIYGTKYAEGGLALAILAVGFATKNVLSVHVPILEALGRSKELSFDSVAAAASNVALNVWLIPQFGIVGAAVATALSFLVRDGLAVWQVRRYLGTVPVGPSAVGPTLLAVPFLLGSMALVPAVPTSLPWLLAATALAGAVYVSVVLVLFGLSETEVMIVRSAEEKYGLDLGPLDGVVTWLSSRGR